MRSFCTAIQPSLASLEVEVTLSGGTAKRHHGVFEGGHLVHGGLCFPEYLDIKDACIRCVIDSATPEKRGMGSSAAISIAAIRAVS